MPWYDTLLQQGYVPAGMTPKRIAPGSTEAQQLPTNSLDVGLRAAKAYMLEQQQEEEKRQKKLKSDADMYRTLRDSGYDPKAAYEAVRAGKMPSSPGGESLDEQKKRAEIKESGAKADYYSQRAAADKKTRERILEKIANGEELTPGEQEVYDSTIKKTSGSDALGDALKEKQIEGAAAQTEKTKAQTEQIKAKQKTISERIKEKVATGEALTPGEQKVYDEVIKKEAGGGSSQLEDALAGKQDKYKGKTKVWTPDGKPAWVDTNKLSIALKRGFKQR